MGIVNFHRYSFLRVFITSFVDKKVRGMKRLRFEAVAKIDDTYAIAVAYDFNAIFKVDLTSYECRYIGMVPRENSIQQRLYSVAIKADNCVYFVPASANVIAVFDYRFNRFEKIDYGKNCIKESSNYKNNSNFNGAVKYGKYIFMIPFTFPGVVRIDTEDNSIEIYKSWMDGQPYIFKKEPVVLGDKFYIPNSISNSVLEFDMSRCEGHMFRIGNNNAGCWSMIYDKGLMWFSPQKEGPVLSWNMSNDDVTEYPNYPKGFSGNGFCFTKIYKQNDKLCFIPAKANMGISLSTNTGEIKRLDIEKLVDADAVQYMFEINDYIFLNVTRGSLLESIKIKKSNNQCDPAEFHLSLNERELYGDFGANVCAVNEPLKESTFWGLTDFIKSL